MAVLPADIVSLLLFPNKGFIHKQQSLTGEEYTHDIKQRVSKWHIEYQVSILINWASYEMNWVAVPTLGPLWSMYLLV